MRMTKCAEINLRVGDTLQPICLKANELGLQGIRVIAVRVEGGEDFGEPCRAILYSEENDPDSEILKSLEKK